MKIVVSSLLIFAILAVAVSIGSCVLQQSSGNQDAALDLPEGVPQEFSKVLESWAILKEEHYLSESLDAEELSQAAIRGMLEAIDDPSASYLTAEGYSIRAQDLKGSLEGIGATVQMKDGKITVVAPLPDTPAQRAGVLSGDVILEIDGESTEGFSLMDAVSRIRGPKGEPVDLVILHQGEDSPVSLTIVRDVINVASVYIENLEGGIAHIRVTSFSETTNEQMVDALEEVRDSGARGIVLDLRNNPGGLLKSVVDIAGHFLDGGLVLYEISNQGERKDWQAEPVGIAVDIPVVVLVNEFSASGSEVLSGALKDHDRATVIGTTTFGKGSVNHFRQLSDGSALYFAIAHYYTPDGVAIEGQGLEPDITVPPSEDDTEDLQLDKALEVLEARIAAHEEAEGQQQQQQ
jgi:carboxyl-terminal processing protease